LVARAVLQNVELPDQGVDPPGETPLSFTGDETTVLKFIADGYPREDFAPVIGMNVGTLDAHIASVYRKLRER
jgi:DNA-binding NarL/FixJ family response regulator